LAIGVFAMAAMSGAAVSDGAGALRNSALVFDAHVHAVDRVFYHGGDIGTRKPDGQFDLPRAREGGLKALFFPFS
jgi:membrane dipeptidase